MDSNYKNDKNCFQLSKKKEIVEAKARSQAQIMLPKEMQEDALKAFVACSPVRK